MFFKGLHLEIWDPRIKFHTCEGLQGSPTPVFENFLVQIFNV